MHAQSSKGHVSSVIVVGGNHLLRPSMGASASTGIAAALKASSSDELVKVVGGLDEATKKKLLEALDGPKNKG